MAIANIFGIDPSGDAKAAAVDESGNILTAGAGTAGSPSGGVQSVQGAGLVSASATIANGESLSGAVDLNNARLASIQMPAAWTAANLTFQASADGVTYADLYDNEAVEYTVQAAASRVLIVPLVDFLGIRYLKVRSGTSAAAVAQGAERMLALRAVP
jgi:hypothetical protein